MFQYQSGFSGVDTLNIITHSDFRKTSKIISIHEYSITI